MRRHLALLRQLLTYRRPEPPRSAEELLDQVNRHMQQRHSHNRERAVIAITQRNNLQSQVLDLERRVSDAEQRWEEALREGNRALADQFYNKRSDYDASLASSRETLMQAEETAEQVKRAIKCEEELLRQRFGEVLALKSKWKQAAIQETMEWELKEAGLWELGQPREPEIDKKTARELVIFLLAVIIALSVVLLRR